MRGDSRRLIPPVALRLRVGIELGEKLFIVQTRPLVR